MKHSGKKYINLNLGKLYSVNIITLQEVNGMFLEKTNTTNCV